MNPENVTYVQVLILGLLLMMHYKRNLKPQTCFVEYNVSFTLDLVSS